ncbi:MAG: hypothetical protein ACPG7F_05715 [Aggregatilineales bacterium]
MGVLLCIGVLVACQPESDALPTLLNPDEVSADTAATIAADEALITPTAIIPTLPSTALPTRTPLPPPTETPVIPTPTPIGYNERGTLFYIYNGDSITRINGDGTDNEIIATFGVGIEISDLKLSPDGAFLAYIAPGAGSAREVFITTLDGSYVQQVSCLGFAEVREITWTPNSQSIAFFGAELPTTAGNIYIADVVGSGQCPQGNNQRVLYPAQTTDLRDMTFNRDGSILLYAGAGSQILAYEVTGEAQAAVPFTFSSGFGPDLRMAQAPEDDRLAYITTVFDTDTGEYSGGLIVLGNSAVIPDEPFGQRSEAVKAQILQWSQPGNLLLIVGEERLYYVNDSLRIVNQNPLPLAPAGAISFDETEIAFVIPDRDKNLQIFAYEIETDTVRQITYNPEGTIEDMVWITSPIQETP